jgi:hypothetical protein
MSNIIKYSRATSLVNWLSGEKNNVSKIIFVLVFRVLMYLVRVRVTLRLTVSHAFSLDVEPPAGLITRF